MTLREHDEKDCKGEPCLEHGDPESFIVTTLLFILIAILIWIEFF